jgi:hypothetical protein
MTSKRKVEVFINAPGELRFPEQHLGLHADRPSVGLCFSGGGARALSASMGQYRALTKLGLMDKVRVIASVSGGTWASFIYTYYRAGAANDDELLGPITEPGDIDMASLREPLPRSCMGFLVTQAFDRVVFQDLRLDKPQEVWMSMIGQLLLAPFGLYDPERPRTISLDEASVARILARQHDGHDLSADHFVIARPGRPFLIANACLIAPTAIGSLDAETPALFEFTPLYVGSPNPLRVSYDPRRGDSLALEIGGGSIEPFGCGGEGPHEVDAGTHHVRVVELSPPIRACTTEFIAGTSSAAPAGVLEELPGLGFLHLRELTPEAPHWPVREGPLPAAQEFDFGDGGVLENYGLISLLLRRIETAVVFINTNIPLSLDYDPSGPVDKKAIDTYLPPLFGLRDPSTGTATQNNQVFATSDYAKVVRELQAAKRSGGAVMAVTKLTTVANSWWGVAAGHEVQVCWMYLDRSAKWEASLGSRRVRWNIRRGNSCKLFAGPFKHFPHYRTIMEIPLELIELTDAQVRLLADLSCWCVTSNAERFKQLFA